MAHVLQSIEGLATVVIAVYVAYLGRRQWITAQEKLRVDLYNRRFDVYTNAVAFMQALTDWNFVPTEDRKPKRTAFILAMRESQFLFADEPQIFRLLDEFNRRSYDVTNAIEEWPQYSSIMPKEVMEALNEKQSSLQWIMESIVRLETMLMPYLAFQHRAFAFWPWIRKP